jgi:hypothetical protein
VALCHEVAQKIGNERRWQAILAVFGCHFGHYPNCGLETLRKYTRACGMQLTINLS